MKISVLTVTAAVAGIAAGVAGAVLWFHAAQPQTGYPTFRSGIKSATDEALQPCKQFPFDANNHPTEIFQVKLTGVPFDIRNLKPVITVMDVNASPWLEGDPKTARKMGPIPWSPNTPLDLDLNLDSSTGSGKNNEALIKFIVDDQNVTMIADPYSVVSGDVNKKMFCRFSGGFGTHDATFMVTYYKPHPNEKTFGSFNLGLNIPGIDNSYTLPIYIDPEVENNGIS